MTRICQAANVNLNTFVVANAKDGKLKKLETDKWWKLLKEFEQPSTDPTFVHFPSCSAELWSQLPANKLSPLDVIAMPEEKLEAMFPDINGLVISRTATQCAAWYRAVLGNMIDAGLLDVNPQADSVASAKSVDEEAKKGDVEVKKGGAAKVG